MKKNFPSVILKPGKEKALLGKHHWIFSGAVAVLPSFDDGDILSVKSAQGVHLGYGYFNRKASIIGRMVTFQDIDPLKAIEENLIKAITLRNCLFDEKKTNAYRLINGEGDGLPGLTVDKYADILVIQISTLGMEKLLPFLLKILKLCCRPTAIFEKSNLPSRKQEGLKEQQLIHVGNIPDLIQIKENEQLFKVSILEGQKTGFFLDQREMRALVGKLACEKRVLNCFGYTGGFSVYAAAGGAKGVTTVDISDKATGLAEINMDLNGFAGESFQYLCADVFDFLRKETLDYDLVILDPPAFAKKQKDVIPACRGYKDINRLAMKKMPSDSILLTCSCSYYVDEGLFKKVLFQAANEAERNVRIIDRHHLAADHPINICHPEGDYLKSFLLYIQ